MRLVLKNSTMTGMERQEMRQAIDGLYDWINQSFGMSEFEPDPDLWTDDAYRNMTGKEALVKHSRIIYGRGGEKELGIRVQ
jgi:hypothetical protein